MEDKKIKKTADQIESNLGIIISEGQRLTSLINDVLDIAKMEAGKIEWKDERFTARYAIEHAVSATSSLFQEKGLAIVTDIEDGLPDIYADKDRFIQVIINILLMMFANPSMEVRGVLNSCDTVDMKSVFIISTSLPLGCQF